MTIAVKFRDGRGKKYPYFKEITCLGNYNDIVSIDCPHSQLTELPTLPSSLEYLSCHSNQLTELPTLPSSLEELQCTNNQLTELPKLPDSLKYLDCSDNQITELPTLPESLKELDCSYNQLREIPKLPDFLEYVYCSNNPIHDFIQNHFDGNVIIYQEKKLAIQKISNWFLECKGNPKYAYCRKVVNRGYDDLNNSV